jgi:hypothetical protein
MMTGLPGDPQPAIGQPGIAQSNGAQGMRMTGPRKIPLLEEQPLLLEDLLEQVVCHIHMLPY